MLIKPENRIKQKMLRKITRKKMKKKGQLFKSEKSEKKNTQEKFLKPENLIRAKNLRKIKRNRL